MLNFAAVLRSPAFDRGETGWGGPEELDAAFADCCDAVHSAMEHLWRNQWWPMADREPISGWVDGRTVLVGDAAHPVLQYPAQGACQALEAFAERRTPRTERVRRTARVWGEIWRVDDVGRTLATSSSRRVTSPATSTPTGCRPRSGREHRRPGGAGSPRGVRAAGPSSSPNADLIGETTCSVSDRPSPRCQRVRADIPSRGQQ